MLSMYRKIQVKKASCFGLPHCVKKKTYTRKQVTVILVNTFNNFSLIHVWTQTIIFSCRTLGWKENFKILVIMLLKSCLSLCLLVNRLPFNISSSCVGCRRSWGRLLQKGITWPSVGGGGGHEKKWNEKISPAHLPRKKWTVPLYSFSYEIYRPKY